MARQLREEWRFQEERAAPGMDLFGEERVYGSRPRGTPERGVVDHRAGGGPGHPDWGYRPDHGAFHDRVPWGSRRSRRYDRGW